MTKEAYKLAVFTVMLPDMLPEQAASALKAEGYDGVEWRITHTPEAFHNETPSYWRNNLCTFVPTLENAQKVKQVSHDAGLELCNLGTYLSPDDIDAVEAAMQFAVSASAKSLRVNTAKYQGDYHGAFEKSLRFYEKVETLAKRYNVKALVETHQDLITSSASLTHRFVSHFDPHYVGVIYDPGNMVIEGYEQHKMGLQLLGPYVSHVHLKNAAYQREEGKWQPYWAAIDDGIVDMKRFLSTLLEVGYQGWLVMEDFSSSRSSFEKLNYNIRYVKTLLNEVSV
jgi:sugar phosphate isomerase/epimerase